jgi:hypothetical protein
LSFSFHVPISITDFTYRAQVPSAKLSRSHVMSCSSSVINNSFLLLWIYVFAMKGYTSILSDAIKCTFFCYHCVIAPYTLEIIFPFIKLWCDCTVLIIFFLRFWISGLRALICPPDLWSATFHFCRNDIEFKTNISSKNLLWLRKKVASLQW